MRRQKTIVHVLSSYGVGGAERVVLELARRQVGFGHRVHAISLAPPPDGPIAEMLREIGVVTHTVPKRPGIDWTLPLRLVQALLRIRPDVVHTHNPQPLMYAAAPARAIGARLVHTKHGKNPDVGRKLWGRRAGGHLASAYVAVSEVTAATAKEQRECRKNRLFVVDNGIDLSTFVRDEKARAEVRSELGIEPDAIVLGTVGRASPIKNQAMMIAAARPLLGPQVRLCVVGGGESLDDLRKLATSLGVDVIFTGMRRDVSRLLSAFDVFLLSSDSEGLPLVLAEAMACGLPVITTDAGSSADVVGDAGVVVPIGAEGAFSQAIAGLIADRARMRQLAERATLRARAFDSATMAERYEALYEGRRA